MYTNYERRARCSSRILTAPTLYNQFFSGYSAFGKRRCLALFVRCMWHFREGGISEDEIPRVCRLDNLAGGCLG
jgi:hypothetical protein